MLLAPPKKALREPLGEPPVTLKVICHVLVSAKKKLTDERCWAVVSALGSVGLSTFR